MSSVRAVLSGDWHFQIRKPACRGEEDWLNVQAGYVEQVKHIQDKHGGVPILIAGDLFDRWDSPPELVNFVMGVMPKNVWAVPGNHDLPNRRLNDIHRSAYRTLDHAEVIHDLRPNKGQRVGGLNVVGYPAGQLVERTDVLKGAPKGLNVAVVHDYCWLEGRSFPGASEDKHATQHALRFGRLGFDVILTGDNHQNFYANIPEPPQVYNPGCLIRRTTKEKKYKPRIGLLYSDGSVKSHPLDTSADVFVDVPDPLGLAEVGLDAGELLDLLGRLQDAAVDFRQAVLHYLKKRNVAEPVQKWVIQWLESSAKTR